VQRLARDRLNQHQIRHLHAPITQSQSLSIGRSSPSCWQGPSLLFWVRGKAQRVESRGSQPLPTSYGVWGSTVSSPSGVRCRALAAKTVLLHSKGARWPLLELAGGQMREGARAMAPLPSPPQIRLWAYLWSLGRLQALAVFHLLSALATLERRRIFNVT